MNTARGLFTFMPYGAPDLLLSGRRHLAQSLLLATTGAAALYLAIALVAPRFFTTATTPILIKVEILPFIPRLLDPIVDRPSEPGRVTPSVPEKATPLPVPDAQAPLVRDVNQTGEPDLALPPGKGTTGTSEATTTPVQVEEALPTPNEFVYTDQMPEAYKIVEPPYPRLARDARVEGLVIVRALVGKDGSVLDVYVDPRFDIPLLNRAALEAARAWRFTPALRGGRAVAVWTAIPFKFILD